MKKYILSFVVALLFTFVYSSANVLASRNDDRDNRDHQQAPKPTKTPTPSPTQRPTSRDESHNDNKHNNHDRYDRDRDEDCEDPQDPTATPTVRPSVSPSVIPTATPTVTPTATPDNQTQTPTATPNLDVCPNLDGVQTSLPEEYHFDNAGVNCLKFELGGPSQSSGIGGTNVLSASTASTGQVLGASTMAGTGAVEDSIFYSLFSIGSLLTSVGIMRNGKKK